MLGSHLLAAPLLLVVVLTGTGTVVYSGVGAATEAGAALAFPMLLAREEWRAQCMTSDCLKSIEYTKAACIAWESSFLGALQMHAARCMAQLHMEGAWALLTDCKAAGVPRDVTGAVLWGRCVGSLRSHGGIL